MKRTISIILAVILLLSLVSCTKKSDTTVTTQPSTNSTDTGIINYDTTLPESEKSVLKNPGDYDEVLSLLRSAGVQYGSVVTEGMAIAEEAAPTAVSNSTSSIASDSVSVSKPTYSETNVQVYGIDEADVVKTDGEYIYVLKSDGTLVILKADGGNTEVISKTQITKSFDNKDYYYDNSSEYFYESTYENCSELYIFDKAVSVIINYNHYENSYKNETHSFIDENRTVVRFYNIEDPSNPQLVNEFSQDGYYNTSRLYNGKIYLITNYYPSNYSTTDKGGYIPYTYINDEMAIMPIGRIYCPIEVNSSTYTVISEITADGQEKTDNLAFLGSSSTVYMSGNSIYLASQRFNEKTSEEYKKSIYSVVDYKSGQVTDITRISLDSGLFVAAACTIDGYLNNQFSLDEYNGYLRAVTTVNTNRYSVYTDPEMDFVNYKWDDSETTNSLYVLDSELTTVGAITGLAEDERVYSVRFDGETGYFVTFRQTDPLFAVDLSDPGNPRITSELKIPGFSEYLHPYTDTLLFGIGRNADTETGRADCLKLSMFDTSDPFNVKEVSTELIEGIYYSAAEYNHKAILVNSEKNIIGFPVSGRYLIYSFTGTSFIKTAEVTLDEYTWWGEYRGLYVDSYFYIISENACAVLNLDTFEKVSEFKF